MKEECNREGREHDDDKLNTEISSRKEDDKDPTFRDWKSSSGKRIQKMKWQRIQFPYYMNSLTISSGE